MENRWEHNGNWFIFVGSKITTYGNCSHVTKRCFIFGKKKAMTSLDSVWKSRDHFADKYPYSQSYNVSSHIRMWVLDHEEVWALKNCSFQTVVLEKTPESLLDSKEIKPVYPKGNQSRIFIGKADAEAETPILRPLIVERWLIG